MTGQTMKKIIMLFFIINGIEICYKTFVKLHVEYSYCNSCINLLSNKYFFLFSE